MGSEMCIRDRDYPHKRLILRPNGSIKQEFNYNMSGLEVINPMPCLLYTSDAADERSSVDLGGRRIIKKKKYKDTHERHYD